MRKIKLLLAAFLFITVVNAQEQDTEKDWFIGIGINSVDIRTPDDFGGFIKDWVGMSDINVIPATSRLSIGKKLNYGLTAEVSGSLNKIEKGFGWSDGDKKTSDSFWSLDARLRYDLKRPFGKVGGWFDPYVQAGVGFSHYGSEDDFKVMVGPGFNTWISDQWGLNFQTVYAHCFESTATDYFQHSISIVVRF